MQAYIKDRANSRWYDLDFDINISCEYCNIYPIVDIHHISQSMRWKRKHNKDGSSLLWLCRECHEWIHSNNTFKNREKFIDIVSTIIKNKKT